MQTFLPYSDFEKSAACLDNKRLNKQRVEALQLINTIERIEKNDILKPDGKKIGWLNFPATKMWKNNKEALKLYFNVFTNEWIKRGFNNTMELYKVASDIELPPFIGNEEYHASHRSNLLRKDEPFYRKFGWIEPTNLPYIWPVPK